MSKEELMEEAKKARGLSYSPYSHFAVGAALLTKSGKVYLGANVENSSYGLSMCAERNAVYHALMEGEKPSDFLSLAVLADCERPCPPCGACRQVLSEFFTEDAPIYLGNLQGDILVSSVKELLPLSFGKNDL